MTTEPKQILKEALELPPVERAELLEQILASFDFASRKQIDALWADEAEDRIDAHERGEVRAKPIGQVFDALDGRRAR